MTFAKTSSRARVTATVIAIIMTSVLTAGAQTRAAVVRGLVVDQSDARLPAVSITVESVPAGSRVTTTTNSNGEFVVRNLPAGAYRITARLAGFEDDSQFYDTASGVIVHLRLKVKELKEPITLSGAVPASRLAFSGATVTGEVRFTRNGEAVPGIKVTITRVDDTTVKVPAPETDAAGRFSVQIPDDPTWRHIDVHLRDAGIYSPRTVVRQDAQQFLKLAVEPLTQVSAADLPRLLDELDHATRTGIDPDALAMAADAIARENAELLEADLQASQRVAALQAVLRVLPRTDLAVLMPGSLFNNMGFASLSNGGFNIGGAELRDIRFNMFAVDAMTGAAPAVDGFDAKWPQPAASSFLARASLDGRVVPPLDVTTVTRPGHNRHGRVAYSLIPGAFTSAPVQRECDCPPRVTGFRRDDFHDVSSHGGGTIVRGKLWLYGTYDYRLDVDAQPGTDPALPARRRAHQLAERLIWNATEELTLTQSFRDAVWTMTDVPTVAEPFATQVTYSGRSPAIKVDARHVVTPVMFWEANGSWSTSPRDRARPNSGASPARWQHDFDTGTTGGGSYGAGVFSRQRISLGGRLMRIKDDWLRANHTFRLDAGFERREDEQSWRVPGGGHLYNLAGAPHLAYLQDPSHLGAATNTFSVSGSDEFRLRRVRVNAGLRYDGTRGLSEDLREVTADGQETGRTIAGRGDLFVSHSVLPHAGVNISLRDRLSIHGQATWALEGVGRAKLAQFHPGNTPLIIRAFDPGTGDYSIPVASIDPAINLRVNPRLRVPRSRTFRAGVSWVPMWRAGLDAEYLHTDQTDLMGWTDIGGDYALTDVLLPDGRTLPAWSLRGSPAGRLFELGNPEDRAWRRDAVAVTFRKSWSGDFRVFAGYLWSKTRGLTEETGMKLGPGHVMYEQALRFGQDPNDLTFARGELPVNRRHSLRLQGGLTVPRIELKVDAEVQHVSGRTYTGFAYVNLPQGTVPIFVEPAGSRGLPAQTYVAMRLARRIELSDRVKIDLMIDLENLLNETSRQQVVTGNVFSPNFAAPLLFPEPRRAALGFALTF